jgi:hypothetical protein
MTFSASPNFCCLAQLATVRMNKSAALAMLFAVALLAATGTGSRALHFEAACNYPCPEPCASAARFGLLPCNATVTGGVTDRVGAYGAWPTLFRNGSVMSNGGVPQAANLTLHLELVARDVERRVPDANFSGRLVLDFEKWRPTWALDAGTSEKPYQTFSLALVRAQQPAIAGNATAVAAAAKAAFEAAGLEFFVATLRRVRQLRPRALAGYFSYPDRAWGGCAHVRRGGGKLKPAAECGYADPATGPALRAANDRLAPLWAASAALYPSAYLFERSEFDPPRDPQESNATWRARLAVVTATLVGEAARLSAAYGGGIPVIPFTWDLYATHPFTTAVSRDDVAMWLDATWRPPLSTAVVLWGYWPSSAAQRGAMANVTGPALLAAKQATAACAAERCGGRGWCSSITLTPSTHCVCRAGWEGTTCNRRAL